MTRMAPFKDDIYFENLHHTEAEKTTFRYIGCNPKFLCLFEILQTKLFGVNFRNVGL